ncbi:MAG: DUF4386 domain-containing protein [Lysobacter sp.]|nr:DUF4386 domain-containing protein [Lysobacter sp.]
MTTTGWTPRPCARVAGAGYLLTIACGVFAEVFARQAVMVRDDPAATSANLLAHAARYRWGLAADEAMLVAYIVVTGLFYLLFKPGGRRLSLLAACFSLVGIAVLGAASMLHAAPLVLLDPAAPDPQAQRLALAALRLHGWGYQVADVFFGVYCVLIGVLAWRSRQVPRALGALMVIGGLGYLASSVGPLLAPDLSLLGNLSAVGGIAELALTLWLLAFGVRATAW